MNKRPGLLLLTLSMLLPGLALAGHSGIVTTGHRSHVPVYGPEQVDGPHSPRQRHPHGSMIDVQSYGAPEDDRDQRREDDPFAAPRYSRGDSRSGDQGNGPRSAAPSASGSGRGYNNSRYRERKYSRGREDSRYMRRHEYGARGGRDSQYRSMEPSRRPIEPTPRGTDR